MTVAYFDAFSGVSGDMTVGALLALGLPLEHLRTQLDSLALPGCSVRAETCSVHGIQAVKFAVTVGARPRGRATRHPHRTLRDVRELIEASTLDQRIRDAAVRIFHRLAEAEGRVHGMPPDAVTFHEVGAVDSIVDIVGSAIGFTYFGIDRAYVSALPAGSGMVQTRHGPLPVPAPATAELLRGYTLRAGDGEGELVTPTGAAIVATLAQAGPPPPMRVTAVGYGAGTRDVADRPNVLRLMLGETETGFETDELVVIETNVDDTNPELFEFVFERLLAAGARDVFLSPVHMKKNRPGMLLRVLAAVPDRERLAAIVLSETTAIGVRTHRVDRLKLPRRTATVSTTYGRVRVKIARTPEGHENVAPEYEDCARVARARNVPLKLVYQAAVRAYRPRSTRSR